MIPRSRACVMMAFDQTSLLGPKHGMVIEIVVEVKDIEKRSAARVHQHMAHIRIERSHFGSSCSFVLKMSRTGRALKNGPGHRGKAGELTALSAEQAGCGCGDRCAVQTAAQLRANAATGSQTHAHGMIESFSEAIEILFWRAQTQLRQLLCSPMTPELFLFPMDTERITRGQMSYVAKDGRSTGCW